MGELISGVMHHIRDEEGDILKSMGRGMKNSGWCHLKNIITFSKQIL